MPELSHLTPAPALPVFGKGFWRNTGVGKGLARRFGDAAGALIKLHADARARRS